MNKFSFGRKANNALQDKKLINLMLIASVIALLVSGWAWWHFVRSNPENTFYGMIENNLQSTGFTKKQQQSAGDQKLNQTVQLNVGRQDLANGYTVVTQGGAGTNARVETETISTPANEFVRYTSIETDQKNSQGSALDYSGLEDIWGEANTEGSESGMGDLYSNSVLGVIPVGNLNAADREKLVEYIKKNNVYDFSERPVKRENANGRPTYSYTVTAKPEAYIGMLKEFGQSVGLEDLEKLNPEDYKNAQPLSFGVVVDVWSRQVKRIIYDGGARAEDFLGYGIRKTVELPDETIPLEELQAKLQEVQ